MNLTLFEPVTINDLSANGGLKSSNYITNSTRNNLLPDVTENEVTAGLTRLRKFFVAPNITTAFIGAFLKHPSPSMDKVLIHAGSSADTQAEATAYTSWKGSGLLKTAISAGALASLIVVSENEGYGFNDKDLIRLSYGAYQQFIRIVSVSWAGDEATLTCAPDTAISNSYPAGAYISATIERGRANLYSFWIKEIVPVDSALYIDNINRIGFSYRS